VVVRRILDIPQEWAGKGLTLSLGAIDDSEDTYFNGERIGHTDKSTPQFWSLKRSYTVPGQLVKAGKNVLAVRVFDHYGGGGFYASKEDFHLAPKDTSEVTFYHPDYRTDFELGDDPYRYFP
jgi:hypothetical protein